MCDIPRHANTIAALTPSTRHPEIQVGSFSPPLRWVHNYGAAGVVTFRGAGDAADVTRSVYLAQGATHEHSFISEIKAMGGTSLTGGY